LRHQHAAWDHICESLLLVIDAKFNVFEGCVFKPDKFERELARRGIPWLRTENRPFLMQMEIAPASST